MMPRIFKADLHIHTCLSPCAELNMGPKTIVQQALQQGLDVIGISDHNSSENVSAVMRAAQDRNLKVLPGMEVTTKEEVHILAVFDSADRALQLQEIVYEHLPGENDPEAFGLQVVVNEDHDVLGFNKRLLAGATELSVEQVVDSICSLDGLAIAAHVDRETFGILGQLGFIPEELHLDGLELSRHTSREEAKRRFPEYARYAFLRSSDAHSATDIGKVWTSLLLVEPSMQEIRKALRGEDGRRVVPEDVNPNVFRLQERVSMGLRPAQGDGNRRCCRPREGLALSLPKGLGPGQSRKNWTPAFAGLAGVS